MRRIGFYIRDFTNSPGRFEVSDFDDLVFNSLIQIVEDDDFITKLDSRRKPVHGKKRRKDRDEWYILDLCDEVLNLKGDRQKHFPFLVGDSGKKLPVDAYYKELQLVIEYHERQHTEPIKIFNRPKTVSGVDRTTQRIIYDQRRRDILPQNGITLVELSYDMFQHNTRKKLIRVRGDDLAVVKKKLQRWSIAS